MGVLGAIIILWVSLFFLSGGSEPKPKCPELQEEVKSVFTKDVNEITRYLKAHPEEKIQYGGVDYFMASSSYTWGGEYLGTQIGTTTNEFAIEHNKRVRECQTANRQF